MKRTKSANLLNVVAGAAASAKETVADAGTTFSDSGACLGPDETIFLYYANLIDDFQQDLP